MSGAIAASLRPMLRRQLNEFGKVAVAITGTDLTYNIKFVESPVNNKQKADRQSFIKSFRDKVGQVVNSTWLERLGLIIVFINCLTLTFHRPCVERQTCDFWCITWRFVDKVALAFFLFEMCCKLIHRGPVRYLEDRWHCLDVMIVAFGMMEELLLHFQINLASIRAMRILRPVRTIEWIPSVRLLVSLLWDTLPMLANVFLLSIFFFIVFGIMAVQLWAGMLRQRCYHTLNVTNFPENFPDLSAIRLRPFYVPSMGDYICSTENGLHQCGSHLPSSRSTTTGKECFLSVESAIEEWNEKIAYFANATFLALSSMPPGNMTHLVNATLSNITVSTKTMTTTARPTTPFISTTMPVPILSDCINWNRIYNTCRGGVDNPNPFEGAISFDNVLMAWVAIFQIITLEGWSDIMYFLQDAHSFWVFLYFVPLILFGSYFLINLCLACITIQLARSQYLYYTQVKKPKSSSLRSNSSIAEVIIEHWTLAGLRQAFIRSCFRLSRFISENITRERDHDKSQSLPDDSTVEMANAMKASVAGVGSYLSDKVKSKRYVFRSFSYSAANFDYEPRYTQRKFLTSVSSSHSIDTGTMLAVIRDRGALESFVSSEDSGNKSQSFKSQESQDADDEDDVFFDPADKTDDCEGSLHTAPQTPINIAKVTVHRSPLVALGPRKSILVRQNAMEAFSSPSSQQNLRPILPVIGDDEIEIVEPWAKFVDKPPSGRKSFLAPISTWFQRIIDTNPKLARAWMFAKPRLVQFRAYLTELLRHPVADYFFMYCITVNTFCLAVEHHDQPRVLSIVIGSINILFTLVFAAELICKVICFGPSYYANGMFNALDALTVIFTVADLFGDTTFSVFRAFRLVRLFKLMDFIPSLRNTLASLFRVVDSALTFLVFLVICMYVFALFGTFLLGGRLCATEDGHPCMCGVSPPGVNSRCICNRKNFDTFSASMLSVFQIFTQESWNELLYESMNKVSPWIALYYVVLVTVGNFVLLNLLIAILVSGFLERAMEANPAVRSSILAMGIGDPERIAKAILSREISRSNAETPFNPEQWKPVFRARSSSLPHFTAEISRGSFQFRHFSHDDLPASATPHQRRKISSVSSIAPTSELASFQSAADVSEKKSIKPPLTTENSLLIVDDLPPVDEAKTPVNGTVLCRQLLAIVGKHLRAEMDARSDWAFFILPPDNIARQKVRRIVEHTVFEAFIFALIAANCLAVAVESPNIDPKSALRLVLDVINDIMTILFTVEMVLKMIALGVFFNHDAYFRSGWNVLDGVLAVVCVSEMIISNMLRGSNNQILSALRVLRMLRALRPLRIINSSRRLRLIVETVFSSMSEIGTVVLICFFFFLIYAIFGVQQFKGCLGRCRGDNVTMVKTRIECLLAGNRWQNDFYNFDNIFISLQTLFIFATFDNWMAIMFAGVDCVGVDRQPQENYNPYRMIFFLTFIIFCGFFLLNIFVGVVVSNFQRNFDNMKARDAAEAQRLATILTEAGVEVPEKSAQKRHVRHPSILRQAMTAQKPAARRGTSFSSMKQNVLLDPKSGIRPPRNSMAPSALQEILRVSKNSPIDLGCCGDYPQWRDRLRYICTHTYFDLASGVAILLNVILMAVEHYDMSPELDSFIVAASYAFTILFALEMCVRLTAVGCRRYFTEAWNIFDAVIVFSSLASTIFEEMNRRELPLNATLVRVMRIAKFARVLKVLRVANTMHRIIDTVGKSLLSVGHLSLLIVLVFFIYAALGVELFGRLNWHQFQSNRDCLASQYKCHVLGEHANFAHMGIAMLTLFRILTGDNWSGLMKDIVQFPCDASEHCMAAPILTAPVNMTQLAKMGVPLSDNGEPLYCCVPTLLPAMYFISFVLVTTLCLLNLVVAVIMGSLEDSYDNANALAPTTTSASLCDDGDGDEAKFDEKLEQNNLP